MNFRDYSERQLAQLIRRKMMEKRHKSKKDYERRTSIRIKKDWQDGKM